MKVTLLSLLALSVAGCAAPVPVAQNFPVQYQLVARTAKHWDVVAQHVVQKTADFLKEEKNQAFRDRSFFVPVTRENTAFDAILRDFTITRMVEDHGMPVSVCPATGPGFSSNDVQIKYDTRIVGHSPLPYYRPGFLTALAAGVFVVHSLDRSISHHNTHPDAAYLAAIAATGLAEVVLSHYPPPTHTEIVVTTTIAENNRFHMRKSDVYYVPDGDTDLFIRRVAESPLCAPTRGAVTAQRDDAMDDAEYRRQNIIREMRRINPEWRPARPAARSFSYP